MCVCVCDFGCLSSVAGIKCRWHYGFIVQCLSNLFCECRRFLCHLCLVYMPVFVCVNKQIALADNSAMFINFYKSLNVIINRDLGHKMYITILVENGWYKSRCISTNMFEYKSLNDLKFQIISICVCERDFRAKSIFINWYSVGDEFLVEFFASGDKFFVECEWRHYA